MCLRDEVQKVAEDTTRSREDVLEELIEAQEELNSWITALEEEAGEIEDNSLEGDDDGNFKP